MEGSPSSGKCSHIEPHPQGACLVWGGGSGTFMNGADPLPGQGLAPMSGQRRWATERLRERAGGPLKAHGGAGPRPGCFDLDGAASHKAGGWWRQESERWVEKGLLAAPGRGTRSGRRARLASAGVPPPRPEPLVGQVGRLQRTPRLQAVPKVGMSVSGLGPGLGPPREAQRRPALRPGCSLAERGQGEGCPASIPSRW